MKILKVIRFNYKIILSFVAMVSLFSFLFSFSFAKSDDEIFQTIKDIVKDGETVSVGGSMTLFETKIIILA